MKRADLTLTIALCASLLLHGLLIDALIERQAHWLSLSIPQPPINLTALLAKHTKVQPITVVFLPKPPPPAPKPKVLQEELFGERGAKGNAMNSTPGDQPMQAPEGTENQATLTPKPGHPSDGGSSGENARKTNPMLPKPTAIAAVPFGLPKQPPLIDPLGNPIFPAPPLLPPKPFHQKREPESNPNQPLADNSPTTKTVATAAKSTTTQPVKVAPTTKPIETAKKPQPSTAPIADASATQPAATTQLAIAVPTTLPLGKLPPATQPHLDHPNKPQPVAVASAAVPTASAATPNVSQGHGPSGDTGHRSESESDPFSDHPVVVYRDGKVEARDGRKVKTVKPKLTEAGRLALQAMDTPVIILEVRIDENGKVTDADFLRKSNKPEVDLPHLQAVYEWEFEPSRDKNGHPHPDTLIIPFVWH